MGCDEFVRLERSLGLGEQRGMEVAKSFSSIPLKNKRFAGNILPCHGLNLTALGAEPGAVNCSYIKERAEFVLITLDEVVCSSKKAMDYVGLKIRSARKRRILIQCIVLIGSSSVLGSLALDGRLATIISGFFTLGAAISNLFNEHSEKLLNTQGFDVYAAYQKLGEGVYLANALSNEIRLATLHGCENDLGQLINKANSLCSELNGWLIQLVLQTPRGD